MDTKTQLLDAAERAARERGYDGFSYADLAASVGIKKASIHYHFPTKADLAMALVTRYRDANRAFRDQVDSAALVPTEKLSRFVAHYRDALGEGDMLCLCVSLALSPDRLSEQVREALNAFHAESIDWLQSVITDATKVGALAHAGDAREEASALLALVEGAQLHGRASGRVGDFDRATTRFIARLRGGAD
ncbi:MAG: TetR/AcrR family transcriptional regulator [Pseudomonadota bacterium]